MRALAALGGRWPPIVVTAAIRAIVDGVHRYHAAKLLNLSFIPCMICDVSDADRFVESVRRNLEQGLPLTLPDRKHAARVILGLHEEWSDRRVAVFVVSTMELSLISGRLLVQVAKISNLTSGAGEMGGNDQWTGANWGPCPAGFRIRAACFAAPHSRDIGRFTRDGTRPEK